MLETLTLGAIQGIAEWLPISSDGMIVLAKMHLFGGGRIDDMMRLALFLHIGTTVAAIVYFRKEITALLGRLVSWRNTTPSDRATIVFYAVATFVSGVLGYGILKILEAYGDALATHTPALMILVGLALCVTGIVQMTGRKRSTAVKSEHDLGLPDAFLQGCLQGLAALPGVSRSGLTVAGFLFRGYAEEDALRISFMLSIPIVIAGNVVLNLDMFTWDIDMFAGLLSAGIVGYATIDILLRVAKKVPLGPFIAGFGVLVILSAFI
jgi:undecaprenyl-diphosphatase